MTDKEFHNGTEAIPWSERGGLAFPRVAAAAAAAAGSGVMTGVFSVRPAPFRSVLGQATPSREATPHLEVHSFTLW